MSVELEYTSTRGEQWAHLELHRRANAFRFASNHYFWVTYWGVMAALAVYVSMFSGAIFMAAIFAAMFFFYLSRAVPYSRVLRWSAEQFRTGESPKHIRLRLDDQGLHETVEHQVESFAPWSACRSFALLDDYLLIELAGDLWANVPRHTVVQGPDVFNAFVEVLRSRNVHERKV